MMKPAAGQHWDAASYDRNARFVSDLGAPVVELLAPRAGETILDLGCGDGALTERIAAAGARVVGADASPELVAAARARGLDARVLDGRRLPFQAEFDAVFTNAALHWMRDLPAVLASVARALVPGGRFAGECGGHGNCAAIVVALCAVLTQRGIDGAAHLPWTFPAVDDFAADLAAAGFAVDAIALIPRPTPLPTGIDGWLTTFAGSLFDLLPAVERDAARAEAAALLRPALCDARGRWTADYVRLRFAAHRV
jgi:SAM-dependent methyltransferase